MSGKRKRVNVSLSPDMYSDLSSLTYRLRFRSVSSLARSMISLLLTMVRNASGQDDDEPDEKYLDEMFEALGEHEREKGGGNR